MSLREFYSTKLINKIRSVFGLSFNWCVLIFLGFIPFAVLEGLGVIYGIHIWNDWQFHLAVFWLFLSPYLLHRAEYTINRVWDRLYPVTMMEESEFNKFKEKLLNLLFKPYYLLLSIVLAIIGVVISWSYYLFVPLTMRLWMTFLIGICLFNAGIGSWGVSISIFTLVKMTKLPIRLNPLNSDNYGGLSVIGNLIIESTILFSSGSIMFPLGIAIVAAMGGTVLRVLTGGLVVFFSAVIIASFAIPVFYLKNCAQKAKKDVIETSEQRYIEKFTEYVQDEVISEKESLELLLLFELFKQTNTIKEWPYSLGTIIKLSLSAAFPLIMGNLDRISSLITLYLGVTLSGV